MKHRFLWLLILVLLLLTQMVFIPQISLQNANVDLLGMVVLAYALLLGKEEGLIMGLAAGFLSDSLFGYPFGLQILIKGALGYGVGFLSEFFLEDQPLVPAIVSLLGFTFTELSSHLANVLFYQAKFWPSTRYWQIFLLSFLIEPFVFVLLYYTMRRILINERRLGWLKD
ncbi:MAG: rod shape-determining protein MreD [Firmicutes bacterium]|jgi:rod shape-determining protein MreD|nr:rod shape-determining protein MreD [Bacillota bacterium]